jgi:hypothetical protein
MCTRLHSGRRYAPENLWLRVNGSAVYTGQQPKRPFRGRRPWRYQKQLSPPCRRRIWLPSGIVGNPHIEVGDLVQRIQTKGCTKVFNGAVYVPQRMLTSSAVDPHIRRQTVHLKRARIEPGGICEPAFIHAYVCSGNPLRKVCIGCRISGAPRHGLCFCDSLRGRRFTRPRADDCVRDRHPQTDRSGRNQPHWNGGLSVLRWAHFKTHTISKYLEKGPFFTRLRRPRDPITARLFGGFV